MKNSKVSDNRRPLRLNLKLTKLSDKRRFFSGTKNLENKTGMERFYMVPDLTHEQQSEDKTLRNKVRRRRDSGAVKVRVSKNSEVADEPAEG